MINLAEGKTFGYAAPSKLNTGSQITWFCWILFQMSDKENCHSAEMQSMKEGYVNMLQQVS